MTRWLDALDCGADDGALEGVDVSAPGSRALAGVAPGVLAGVLAELRARNQEPDALRQLLDEAPQTPKMLEVPAFASYAIRGMRGGAKRERPP